MHNFRMIPWCVIVTRNGGQHAAEIASVEYGRAAWITKCGLPILNARTLDGVWDVKCIGCRRRLFGKKETKKWNDERSRKKLDNFA